MRIGLFWKRYPALRRGYEYVVHLATVWALALSLFLAAGASQAQAAASAPGGNPGALIFTSPSYKGVIGGPPGTRVGVRGSSWIAYSSVELRLTDQAKNCNVGVSIGTFPTNSSGGITAKFNWPLEANHVGAYYVCGIQANKGTFFSLNTFRVLSSSPASLSFTPDVAMAGETITLSGSNWLPAPQTINIVMVPCKSLCTQPPVAQIEVVTGNDGTFSQQVTIASSAATNGYYVQATNSLATIAATAGPLQVTKQAASSATPSEVATRATQDGSVPPPNTTKAALKDALLAAGLGLLALLVLIGGIAFFLARSPRGPNLSASKQPQEPANEDAWSAEGSLHYRSGIARPMSDAHSHWQLPQLPPGRHGASQLWDDEEQGAFDAASPSDDEGYSSTWDSENAVSDHPVAGRRPPGNRTSRALPPRRSGASSRTPPRDRSPGK